MFLQKETCGKICDTAKFNGWNVPFEWNVPSYLCTVNFNFSLSLFHYFQTFLRHPDTSSAKENRQGVFLKMRSAMNTITSVAQSNAMRREPRKGQLVLDLKSFDVRFSFCGVQCINPPLPLKLLHCAQLLGASCNMNSWAKDI